MADNDASKVGLVCVDDDPLMLEFVERRLRQHREQIRCFSEPAAAIDFLARHEVRTILVDQRMPLMDGIEFIEALAATGSNVAARKVLCSAVAADSGTREAADRLGAETLEKDRIRDRETLQELLG